MKGNWTAEDEEQAEAYADEVQARRLKMPPNSCTHCGDGTEPGHELCTGCEKRRAEIARPRFPEMRNVRYAGMRSRHGRR